MSTSVKLDEPLSSVGTFVPCLPVPHPMVNEKDVVAGVKPKPKGKKAPAEPKAPKEPKVSAPKQSEIKQRFYESVLMLHNSLSDLAEQIDADFGKELSKLAPFQDMIDNGTATMPKEGAKVSSDSD